MGLRPVPAPPEPPAVNDITDEKDRLGIVPPEEIEQHLRLTSTGAEMDVGDKYCAVTHVELYMLISFAALKRMGATRM